MAGEKTVDISIGARLDRLDGALREAFSKFEKFDKAVQARQQRDPEKAAMGTFKLGEGIENLAKGVVTLEVLRGGLQSIATFAENADRGVMGIVDALEKLPFGIGGAVEGFRRILGVVTGIGTEIDKLDKFAAAQDKANAAAAARGKAFQDTNKALSQIARGKSGTLENEIDRINSIFDAGIAKANEALKVQLDAKTSPVTKDDPRVIAELKKLRRDDPTMGMGSMYGGDPNQTIDRDRIIKRIQDADDRRAAEMLSAGNVNEVNKTKQLRSEAIAEAYSEYFNDLADKAGVKIVEAAKLKSDEAEKAAKERLKKLDEARDKRSHEWDLKQSATRKAESEMNQRASEIASQKLNPTEVTAQYSGIKEDKSERHLANIAKIQEESARILKEMLAEEKNKKDYVDAVNADFR